MSDAALWTLIAALVWVVFALMVCALVAGGADPDRWDDE